MHPFDERCSNLSATSVAFAVPVLASLFPRVDYAFALRPVYT